MTQVYEQDGIFVVQLDNEYNALDEQAMEEFRIALLGTVSRNPQPRIVIDMSRTDFIGSQVIGILVQVWKRVCEYGGHLVVCGVSPICAGVLHTVRLDQIWDIVPTRQDAMNALADG
jgi:anti-sigma B factor antagonist